MNILYLHTHDSGRFIQPYGYGIPTPNLQSLAQEGVLFRRAFCCAPTCSPSRASMLTGMNPHSNGMLGLAHRGFSIASPERHLASYLQSSGFETVLCGVQHEIAPGQESRLGYDQVLTAPMPDATPAQDFTDRHLAQDLANAESAAAWLRQPKSRPFFLSFGMFSTHRPFPNLPVDIDVNTIQPAPTLPDNPETRADMAGFMSMARCADDCVGVVLEGLRQSGLAEDTLVLFTTDHGMAFPFMKCNLYDAGIGVALIMKFPTKAGQPLAAYRRRAVDALVSHLDVYPTLCAAAGLPQPAWLEGRSLLPLLDGQVDHVREEIFAEVTYHAAYEPMRAIRTERYKYIRYYDDFNLVVKPNLDDGLSKRFLLRYGLENRPHDDPEMLFDLYYDPHERRNLAHDPAYLSIRRDLAGRLEEWMRRTDDPLLKGYVPKSGLVRANLKTALNPNEIEFEA